MRIALVHPPQLISGDERRVDGDHAAAGTGLPVCSSLEAAGHTVRMIDAVGEGLGRFRAFGPHHLHGLTDDEIVERIPTDADVICVGLMFSCTWPATRRLLALIKARRPDRPLILGGEHVTALPHITFLQKSGRRRRRR